jgi:hypothetical protein
MRHITGIVLLVATCTAFGSSQQQRTAKSKPPRGIVTGTVYCGDSNSPARLAQVSLLPANRQTDGQLFMAQSDLDGRFAIGRLPEGAYYVSVKYTGYLDPFPRAKAGDLAGLSTEERRQLEAQAITVSISAQQAATVAVRLDRAAVVEGTVSYDDGSPDIGLRMDIRPKSKSGSETNSQTTDDLFALTTALSDAFERVTDDHGHFRALGLAPGDYLVSTTLSTASGTAPPGSSSLELVKSTSSGGLVFYYGDTPRASEAKTIKITAGESDSDADITIPLRKLHSIRGQIVLKRTGQPPQMASLRLLYADTREFARMAVAINGEFELDYVPEGSYILQAAASTDSAPAADQDEGDGTIAGSLGVFITTGDFDFRPQLNIDQFAYSETPLDVHGELTGIAFEVQDPPAKKSNAASPTVSISNVTVGPSQQ